MNLNVNISETQILTDCHELTLFEASRVYIEKSLSTLQFMFLFTSRGYLLWNSHVTRLRPITLRNAVIKEIRLFMKSINIVVFFLPKKGRVTLTVCFNPTCVKRLMGRVNINA